MFSRHRTPEQWHLPTPFRDSSGGRITIPVRRPSLAASFLVGLGSAAAWLLPVADLQDHVAARVTAYTLCAATAWTASGLLRRYTHEERVSARLARRRGATAGGG